MFDYSNQIDEQTTEMLNGRCVINILASKKRKITEKQILDEFISSTDVPQDLVENELKRILHNGVTSGFIVKTGNRYALAGLEKMYEADCDDNKDRKPSKPCSSSNSNRYYDIEKISRFVACNSHTLNDHHLLYAALVVQAKAVGQENDHQQVHHVTVPQNE